MTPCPTTGCGSTMTRQEDAQEPFYRCPDCLYEWDAEDIDDAPAAGAEGAAS